MQLERIPPSEFHQYFDYFSSSPKYIYFYNSLVLESKQALQVAGGRKQAAFQLYRLKANKSTYWFGRREIGSKSNVENENANAEKLSKAVSPAVVCAFDGNFNQADFLTGFKQFLQLHHPLPVDIFSEEIIIDAITPLFDNINKVVVKLALFYINKEQRSNLIADSLEHELPEEMYIDQIDKQKELEMLHQSWHGGKACSMQDFLGRIEVFPSCCIRLKATKELAAWQIMGWFGQLNHKYTVPEHRRKGLATLLERIVCKEAIQKLGLIPMKCMEQDNSLVLEWAKRAKSWSQLTDEDGQETTFGFVKLLDFF